MQPRFATSRRLARPVATAACITAVAAEIGNAERNSSTQTFRIEENRRDPWLVVVDTDTFSPGRAKKRNSRLRARVLVRGAAVRVTTVLVESGSHDKASSVEASERKKKSWHVVVGITARVIWRACAPPSSAGVVAAALATIALVRSEQGAGGASSKRDLFSTFIPRTLREERKS